MTRRHIARSIGLLVVIAIAVGLWLATGGLSTPVRVWTLAITLVLPLVSIWQVAVIGEPDRLPRIPAYVSSIVSLWLLAGLTATVARFGGLRADQLGLGSVHWSGFFAWSAGQIAVSVAILALASRLGIRESALLIRLLPETPGEKQVFAGLSVTAGFCEEIVFRGFLLFVLAQPFGSIGAVAISSAVFGLSHAYQDARGAGRAGLLGVILALPPVLSGSLWPSIFAHTLIDLIGGIFLKDRLVGKMA